MLPKPLQDLEPLYRSLVYVACLGDEENAFELYRFVPSALEKPLVEATRELLAVPKRERSRVILKELKQLMQAQSIRPLGDVHPGWFFEVLKEESPQTIGLVLRYLPGDKVNYILEHLSPEKRKKLPKMNEAQKVPEELLQILRRRLELQFPILPPPGRSEEINLRHLYFIKTDQLLHFFRELGMDQLAKAFKGVHKTALKALFNRLPLRDAKSFQARVKTLDKLSNREFREAQMLLLDLPVETIDPDQLFFEVGIAFFSKAMTREDLDFVRALEYKFTPKMGYLLKRYVDQSLANSKSGQAEWVRRQVLEKFKAFPLEPAEKA